MRQMGRRRVRTPLGEKRTKDVKVRLTPTEYQQLREAADLVGGFSVGAYVGQIAQAAAQDRPMRDLDSLRWVTEAKSEVQRVGANLNQIAKAINSGQQVPNERVDQVLRACQDALNDLDQAVDDLVTTPPTRSRFTPDQSAKRPQPRNDEDEQALQASADQWAEMID